MFDDLFDDNDSGFEMDLDGGDDNDDFRENDDNDSDDSNYNDSDSFDDFYESLFGDDPISDNSNDDTDSSQSGGFFGLRQMFGGRSSSIGDRDDRTDEDDDDEIRGRNGVLATNSILSPGILSTEPNSGSSFGGGLFPQLNFQMPQAEISNPFEGLFNFDVPNLSVSDAVETVVDKVTNMNMSPDNFESPLEGSLDIETPELGLGDTVERVSESIGDLTLPKLGLVRERDFGDTSFGEFNFGDSGFGDASFGDTNFGDSNFGDSSFGDSSFGFHETVSNIGNAITDVASSFADRAAPDFSLPNYSFNPSEMFSGFESDNSQSNSDSFGGGSSNEDD